MTTPAPPATRPRHRRRRVAALCALAAAAAACGGGGMSQDEQDRFMEGCVMVAPTPSGCSALLEAMTDRDCSYSTALDVLGELAERYPDTGRISDLVVACAE